MNTFGIIVRLVIAVVILILLSTVFTSFLPSGVQQAKEVINLLDYVVEPQTIPCNYYCYSKINPEERLLLGTIDDYTNVKRLPIYFSCNYQLLNVITLAYEGVDIKIKKLRDCFDDCEECYDGSGSLVDSCGDNHETCHASDCEKLNQEFEQIDLLSFDKTQMDSISVFNETLVELFECINDHSKCDDYITMKSLCNGESYINEYIRENKDDLINYFSTSFNSFKQLINCVMECKNCYTQCDDEHYPDCDDSKDCCCGDETPKCDYTTCKNIDQELSKISNGLSVFDYELNIKPKKYLKDYPFVDCSSELTLKNWIPEFKIVNHSGLDLNNGFYCEGLFNACNTELELYNEGCSPAWKTMLLGKGRCEDVAIFYYTLFRTLGVNDYSTGIRSNEVQLKIDKCGLPCPCKELISKCGLTDDYSELSCEAPSKVIIYPVSDFGEISVCEDKFGGRYMLEDPLSGNKWFINQSTANYESTFTLVKSFNAVDDEYYQVRVKDDDGLITYEATSDLCYNYAKSLSKQELIDKCELFIDDPTGFKELFKKCTI